MRSIARTVVVSCMVSAAAMAAPCIPGTLTSYLNLAAGGCQAGAVLFNNFQLAAGQTFALPVDPSAITVTPGGTQYMPTLIFGLNQTASAGLLRESLFQFNASGQNLSNASILLGGSSATGNGAVIGALDVCSGGSFAGGAPLGCSGNVGGAVASVIAPPGPSFPFDQTARPPSSFFNVFVDLTADAASGGGATLGTATVGVTAAPEPGAFVLIAAGLTLLGGLRARRNN